MVQSSELVQVITAHQSNLKKLKPYYLNTLDLFSKYPSGWPIVDQSLRAIGLYYRGEILRAKHDMASYIQGFDVEDHTKGDDYIDAINAGIKSIDNLLDTPFGYEKQVEAELELIAEATKELKEVTYVG